MKDITVSSFDDWLNEGGPAALVIREPLMPVEGTDGVVFPATYAATEDKTFPGGYNIDHFGDGGNVCLIDSVGSQANRIEPIFTHEQYKTLVPQIFVNVAGKRMNLLDAGHRAGDALIRSSTLGNEFRAAFTADLAGDASLLAKLAPTSLVFGVWDSRDTQAKRSRLVASTIRAFNVRELKRSANYLVQQNLDYLKEGILPQPGTKAEKDEYSKRGYLNALATRTHGGVIATGGIRRDATFHLSALRLLAGKDPKGTLALRRYIFGLALTAFTYSPAGYLRQGCNLVQDPDRAREMKAVYPDGRREDVRVPGEKSGPVTHNVALAFARLSAAAFGVGDDREAQFEAETAKKDVSGESDATKPEKSKKTSGKK